MTEITVYDTNNYNLFNSLKNIDQIEKMLPDMTSDGFKGLVANNHISDNDKFNLFLKILNSNTRMSNDTIILYDYVSKLSEEQIDAVYHQPINDYEFFRHLPSIQLIKKYYNDINKSNKFHGITNNIIINSSDRKELIFELLNNK